MLAQQGCGVTFAALEFLRRGASARETFDAWMFDSRIACRPDGWTDWSGECDESGKQRFKKMEGDAYSPDWSPDGT